MQCTRLGYPWIEQNCFGQALSSFTMQCKLISLFTSPLKHLKPIHTATLKPRPRRPPLT